MIDNCMESILGLKLEKRPLGQTLEETKELLLEKIRKQYNSLLNEYPNLKTINDVEKLIKAIKFYKIALLNSKAKKTATKQKQTKLQERIKTLILKDKLSQIIDFNSTKLLEQTTYYKIKTTLP